MLKQLMLCFAVLALGYPLKAQVSFGAGDGVTVKSGTIFSFDGLSLTPSADLAIEDNLLQKSSTAIPGSPASISRVYNFTNSISFQGTVAIHYETDELNSNTESVLQIAYVNTSPATTTGSTVAQDDNIVSNSFSSLTTLNTLSAATAGALPVTLVYFSVKPENEIANLTWNTSSEINSARFEIHRSGDGKIWQMIGQLASSKNSATGNSYTFQDKEPLNGNSLYRLKMVDLDGSFAYSSMRSFHLDTQVAVNTFPNPTVEKIDILAKNTSGSYLVKLFNDQGKIVYQSPSKESASAIDMKAQKPGLYVLQVIQADGRVSIHKIVKQ